MKKLKLCLMQMNSAANYQTNIDAMQQGAAFAAQNNCDLVALPEVSGLMNRNPIETEKLVQSAENDPYIQACKDAARKHEIWMHSGSTPVQAPDGRFLNHSDLIDNTGKICASYDKIHLFDVQLEGKKPIGESKRFMPGKNAKLVDTPWGKWGMTICYDLRFPNLFRTYAQAGANLIFVPSAFTVPTGKAHWEILLRARAIENGVWIVAAAQVGHHEDGRQTYGHAMVINPWGEIELELNGETAEMGVVEIDPPRSQKARQQIPSLTHDRDYGFEAFN